MALYEIITRFEPIHLSTQVEATTDENLREYLAGQTAMWARMQRNGGRCISVVDCSISTKITAVQRRIYADWINASGDLLDGCLVGAAFIMPSIVVRGALTAVFWVARLSAPHTVHSTLEGGLNWALDLARREGLPLSVALEREGVDAFRRLREASA
ncbi:hypothetical protein [Enhygromyxa salina]|uniref:Uncharacterized protein n=1 Tax=Enhygromyxa salina TaxID=215803 RepID=A0A2S9YIX8_9BACT|nr:hypothetical protein [Enhygromyxa salina]PRQ04976.1 hypothetical protein ENSA7_49090 [Enhygromyxa salina]